MRILGSLYHFFLFILVSWTVYNTFLFICLLLPASENEFAELAILDFWNFYLLGALDFHKFTTQISYIPEWLDPRVLRDFWPLLLYAFVVNGLAALVWCHKQNLLNACLLALAPCFVGPFLSLMYRLDGLILIEGIIGIIIFYAILYKLNNYRKQHFPNLTLPIWLEWRMPNMGATLMSITHKMAHMFRRLSS